MSDKYEYRGFGNEITLEQQFELVKNERNPKDKLNFYSCFPEQLVVDIYIRYSIEVYILRPYNRFSKPNPNEILCTMFDSGEVASIHNWHPELPFIPICVF